MVDCLRTFDKVWGMDLYLDLEGVPEMKKRWLILLALILFLTGGAGGWVVKAQTTGEDCPGATATLSQESIDQLAAACLAGCSLVPMVPCPDPCPPVDLSCPECPIKEVIIPDCPEAGDVLVVPAEAAGRPWRLEALLLAHEQGYGAGALWRPHRRLWRLTSVGVLWQEIDPQESTWSPYRSYNRPVLAGGESWGVVATLGIF